MRVGILGSGLMGAKLGTIFSRAGHDVVFSYSRSEDKLQRLAQDARAKSGTPREAAQNADAVLIAVHWSKIDDVLRQAGDLSGRVILTCSLPMDEADSRLVIRDTSSGAEELAKKVDAPVVAAFQTVPSEVLFDVFESRNDGHRPSLLYCGDDAPAKDAAATLIRDAGFDPIDAGGLRVARYTEPFALLVGQIAYEGTRGPQVAYRFEWFER